MRWIRRFRWSPGPCRQLRRPVPLRSVHGQLPWDRWGRLLITQGARTRTRCGRSMAPRGLSEVDLLLGVRDDLREGALRFRLDGEPYFRATEDSGVPVLTDLPALLDIAARAESEGVGYDELRQLIRAGSSLGGARPKAHVTNASLATLPLPSSLARAMTPGMSWPGEKVALDLAGAAYLTVESSQLIRVANRHVLIADRFMSRRGSAPASGGMRAQ